jgi:PIN domain nuclease of toxin-antitoxin system
MVVGIADTHALIWYLYDDSRLSETAGAFMDKAAADGDHIGVSPITLVEVIYLAERGRTPPTSVALIIETILRADTVFVEIPLDLNVANSLQQVKRDEVPDMPDRIIAATAVHLRVPVISRDGRIRTSAIQTVW